MKKKLNIIAFAIVVCVVSTLNVKIALNTNVLCDLAMTSINALGSGQLTNIHNYIADYQCKI